MNNKILFLMIALLVLSACEYNGMAILEEDIILTQDYEQEINLPTEINLKSLTLSGRIIGEGSVFAYLNVNNRMYKILDGRNLEYQEFKNVCENSCDLDVSSSKFSIVFLIEDAELILEGIDYELHGEKEVKYQQKEVTIQGEVAINKPVQYKKIITLEEQQPNIKVQLDPSATDVIIIDAEKNIQISPEKINLQQKQNSLSTGEKLKEFFSGSPTGFAVFTQSAQENMELDVAQKTKAIEVEYSLPGPTAEEKIISGTNKQIIISSDIHYKDILSYTEIPDVPLESINLYWVQQNGEKINQQFKAFDFNENNLVDYIEWITPHLSTQTYEVEINVLNVQSYPSIGGTWTVEFTTAGQKDLIITGEDGTKFEQDINHLSLKCGEKEVDPFYDGNSVIYPDYQCDEISYHTVEVITKGKHTQKFTFGNLYDYAHNLASNVPDTLNIQGQLTNTTGDLQNGTFDFEFKLYTVATGGSAIWEENQTLSVNSGIYDAVLGTVTEISLDFSDQYYLGIAVGGDSEMTPRINISSTPYSQRSKFADSLDCTDCVNQSHIQDNSINSSFIQADVIDGTELSDTITLDATLAINNQDVNFDSNTLYINSTSNQVGIGTATTGAGLDVEVASGGAATFGKNDNSATGDYAVAMGAGTTASNTAAVSMGRGTTASGYGSVAMGREITAGGEYVVAIALSDQNGLTVSQANSMVVMGGNVGIATSTPSSELDVNGTIRTVEICDESGSNCKDVSAGWTTDTDTWWGLNSGYIYNNSNSLDFNETKLNATIDARDSDTTYSAGSGLDLGGTEFSHTDTSSQATSDNSGRTYIQDITLDTYGHITGLATATETVTDTNTNANTECSGSTTYFDGEGNCDTLDGLEDFETATDDGVSVGSGSAFATKILPDCDDSSGNHLNYDTTTNAFSCGTSGDGYEADTDTQDLSYDAGTDVISLTDGGSIDITEVDTDTDTTYTAGSHLTLTDTTFSVDDDYLLNTGDTASGFYNFTGHINVANNVTVGGTAYITGDAQEITLHSPVNNNLLRIRDSRIQSTTTFRADNYESGDGTPGTTDTTSYSLCSAPNGLKCDVWCTVQIKDGLITGCS